MTRVPPVSCFCQITEWLITESVITKPRASPRTRARTQFFDPLEVTTLLICLLVVLRPKVPRGHRTAGGQDLGHCCHALVQGPGQDEAMVEKDWMAGKEDNIFDAPVVELSSAIATACDFLSSSDGFCCPSVVIRSVRIAVPSNESAKSVERA